MATLTSVSLEPVQDLLQLAQQALRVVGDLHRSGAPVSPNTYHALLNDAALAIEAIRSKLLPPETLAEGFARLAPWAEPMVLPAPAAVAPSSPAAAPEPKRTRKSKAQTEADVAAGAGLQPLALKEDRTPAQLAADGDAPVAVTNPMPVETAQVMTTATSGVPVTVSAPPNLPHVEEIANREPATAPAAYDRTKAEAVLKETGDAFRASEAARREREASATSATPAAASDELVLEPVDEAALDAAFPAEPAAADWKASLKLTPEPEDVLLPWKQGQYAGKKFSDCSLYDAKVILINYIKSLEGEADPEKRAQRAIWAERAAAWHRHRLDWFLVNSSPDEIERLRVDYRQQLETPTPSVALAQHRKDWCARIDEIAKARKESRP